MARDKEFITFGLGVLTHQPVASIKNSFIIGKGMTKGWEFITHVLWVLAYPPIISVNNIRQKKNFILLYYNVVLYGYLPVCLSISL